jgi:hypothetical protein
MNRIAETVMFAAGRARLLPVVIGLGRLRRFRTIRRLNGDAGAATAEYAVATMAAVGFAGLLIVILRGDEVRGILTELVRNALTVG